MSALRVHLGADREASTTGNNNSDNNSNQTEQRDSEKPSVHLNGLSLSPALHHQHTVKQYGPTWWGGG